MQALDETDPTGVSWPQACPTLQPRATNGMACCTGEPKEMGEIREYDNYDALGLAGLVERREVSAGELLETAIARAERVQPKLNAIVHAAHDQASAAIARGLPDGPFSGVPFLL